MLTCIWSGLVQKLASRARNILPARQIVCGGREVTRIEIIDDSSSFKVLGACSAELKILRSERKNLDYHFPVVQVKDETSFPKGGHVC